MRKIVLFLIISLCIHAVNAQIILDENFDYPVGNIRDNAKWEWFENMTETDPVQVVTGGLTFDGYGFSDTDGKSVRLNPTGNSGRQDVYIALDQTISSGTAYLTFLVKIDKVPAEGTDIRSFFAGFSVNGTSNQRARLAAVETSENKYKFQIIWNNNALTSEVYKQYNGKDFTYGETYLVVLEYNIDDKVANAYFFDDVPPESKPGSPNIHFPQPAGQSGLASIGAVNLWQSLTPQDITIDGMVVATSWNDIFKAGQAVANFNDITVEVGVDPITLNATVPTGNPLTYSIETGKESVVTLAGNVVTIVGVGTAKITAMAEGTDEYLFARKTITLSVVPSLDWLKSPAIAVEGNNIRVAGPGHERFTKIFINGVEGNDLTGVLGDITIRATTNDGSEIIRLVINR